MTMRTTRFRSAVRARLARSDDFMASAPNATAEAEAPSQEAQQPGRIDFDDDVNDYAPVDNGLAAAETQIQEQVNKRVAEARALRARELTRNDTQLPWRQKWSGECSNCYSPTRPFFLIMWPLQLLLNL